MTQLCRNCDAELPEDRSVLCEACDFGMTGVCATGIYHKHCGADGCACKCHAVPTPQQELAMYQLLFINAMDIAAMQGFPTFEQCEKWILEAKQFMTARNAALNSKSEVTVEWLPSS